MRLTVLSVAAAASLGLAACGSNQIDRTVTGAGLGAATGVAGAALTGGNLGTGAIVGGAAGAIAGAVTDADDINLGKPIWRR